MKIGQEIAAASIEQNSGADEINNAIQQLNLVTQQNASSSEEIATSSEELFSQAKQLLETISFFKVGEMEGQRKYQYADNKRATTIRKPQNRTTMFSGTNKQQIKSSKGVQINLGAKDSPGQDNDFTHD